MRKNNSVKLLKEEERYWKIHDWCVQEDNSPTIFQLIYIQQLTPDDLNSVIESFENELPSISFENQQQEAYFLNHMGRLYEYQRNWEKAYQTFERITKLTDLSKKEVWKTPYLERMGYSLIQQNLVRRGLEILLQAVKIDKKHDNLIGYIDRCCCISACVTNFWSDDPFPFSDFSDLFSPDL